MLIPSDVSTSELPDLEVIDLFPCFATFSPHAEDRMAVAVEILKLPLLSPPVPQVSIKSPSS